MKSERPLPETGVKLRCYDNGGESIDRYTVVYCGTASRFFGGRHPYVAMSGAPFHPQGFGQHGEHVRLIDRPKSSHLGKRVAFNSLPDDCRKLVMQDLLGFAKAKSRNRRGPRRES